MRGTTLSIGITLSVIAVLALVAGPLVPAVDFSSSPGGEYGIGSATVSDSSLPEAGVIAPDEYDDTNNYLRLPPATVTFDAIEGRPILVYRLELPALGFQRSNTFILSSANRGRFTAAFSAARMDDESLGASAYKGTLALLLRANDSQRVIATRNVTVTVES